MVAHVGKSLTIEITIFGMNHCESDDALSRMWGFPESLGHHIQRHHGRATMEEDSTACIAQTARRLAEGLWYPEYEVAPAASHSSLEEAIQSRFRNHPAFTPERLAAVVDASLLAINAGNWTRSLADHAGAVGLSPRDGERGTPSRLPSISQRAISTADKADIAAGPLRHRDRR